VDQWAKANPKEAAAALQPQIGLAGFCSAAFCPRHGRCEFVHPTQRLRRIVDACSVSTLRALSGFAVGGGLGSCSGCSPPRCTGLRFCSTPPFKWFATSLLWLSFLWSSSGSHRRIGQAFSGCSGVFSLSTSILFTDSLGRSRTVGDGRTYGLSGWRYTGDHSAGALPSILVGVRFSLGLMWVILIVARQFSALGHRLHDHERARIHANRCHGGRHSAVCNLGETRRPSGERVGTLLAALESGLSDGPIGITLPVTCSSSEVAAAEQRCSRGVSVAIKNVNITFDGRTVLENFDVDISAGEFVAIVGRSGCAEYSPAVRRWSGNAASRNHYFGQRCGA